MIPTVTEEFTTNLEQTFFSIDEKQSALILSLLRNNIYSNPLLSSVKEVLSNCLDEHVKHDVKKPIDITLPNYFNSNLTIRDYAKGISKEFMLNDYTKVGLSTKSEDNLQLGGFGLGRMSPLSYADLYTVTSVTNDHDGLRYKRNYVISKDNNKVFCSLLLEEITDDDTGVLVSFEIASKDFNAIKDYVFDNVKYITNVAISVNKEPAPIVTFKENYKSFRSINVGYFKGSLIGLIGGLPNVIKLDNLQYNLDSKYFDYISNRLTGNYIVFDIGIGQVDQSADKSIQLSERTKKYLANVITTLVDDFKELVEIKIKDFTNYIDIIKFLKDNSLLFDTVTWNGLTVNTNDWLKDSISYSKYRKNYQAKIHNCNYGMSYYHGNNYYYNDLNYVPTVKELTPLVSNLNNLVIVNNIDNTYYNLDLLSSIGLPIDRPPSKVKVRKAPVNRNTKCNRMSKYPGEIGRQLNVDLKVQNVFISNDFYTKYMNDYLRNHLFNYVNNKFGNNRDIYIVSDVSIVKYKWIDLIEHIKDFYKDLDTNFFYYIDTGIYAPFCLKSDIRDKFINDNSNHVITKFLQEAVKFDKYKLDGTLFLKYLKESCIIEFKEPLFCMQKLQEEIVSIYPWFDKYSSFSCEKIVEYIKLVDFYNSHNKNTVSSNP